MNPHKQLYLASNSSRRRDILKKFNYNITIINHNFNESSLDLQSFKTPRHFVKEIAKQKALSVNNHHNQTILAADTIVVLNQQLYSKPCNYYEALSHLSSLQGNTHDVISAFCLLKPFRKKIILKSSQAKVTFNPLSKRQIEDYIKTFKPFDKAGSYGIQECPAHFIKSYSGSIYTIMGLPIYLLNQTIKDSHQVFVSL